MRNPSSLTATMQKRGSDGRSENGKMKTVRPAAGVGEGQE